MTDVPQWAVERADDLFAQILERATNTDYGIGVSLDARDLIARALADAAKPKWGEPDKTASYVLIAMDDGDVEPGYFDQLYNCWRRHDGSEIRRKVTATMPLPAAPEVG